jgi:hypothetical protein
MNQSWYVIPMAALLLAGCEKKEEPLPPAAPAAERIKPEPTKIVAVPESAPDQAGHQIVEKVREPMPSPAPVTPAASRPPVAPPVVKPGVPVATPVEGKPGYVLSPFSQAVIDVRDMPAGTLVQDPGYPASEKKYFRVPE